MLPKCLIMLTSKTLFLALFSLPIVHAMNKMKLNLLQVKEEVGESVSKTLDLHFGRRNFILRSVLIKWIL